MMKYGETVWAKRTVIDWNKAHVPTNIWISETYMYHNYHQLKEVFQN